MSDWYKAISQVLKPAQYLGNEINAVHKDLSKVKTKIALIFPDMYELGMSHLGLKILYHLLNEQPEVAAERAFAPGRDLEELLRANNIPLVSLESKHPLKDFDILGFTLPYEMGYSNVLTILDLAQIPLKAQDRGEKDPLIIGGGACTANPEPLADFFDLFVLGDGEEVVLEVAECHRNWRRSGASRGELLEKMADIKGIYVPSFFEVTYKEDNSIAAVTPTRSGNKYIRRRIVENFNDAYYPTKCLTPHINVVHDRVTMEIARGCTQGCRYCQAGVTYRPRRQRRPQKVAELASRALAATGHEELSLASLSSGDYTCLPRLLPMLESFSRRKIAISMPSMRPGTLDAELAERIKQVRRTGFTIAPEAGSDRLRRVINKKIGTEAILETVKIIFSRGWQTVKLYFMIGLPGELEQDLEAIPRLIRQIQQAAREAGSGRPAKINLSFSAFVPKAHTPFQWAPQDSIAALEEKQALLRRRIPRKGIKMKWHDPYLSFLEGVMSRGDRRLGAVILEAWQKGARFDQWSEHFKYSLWQEAFRNCGLDPAFYARRRSLEETLPWQHLDMGVTREYLQKEYEKSLKEETTPDCLRAGCQGCGVFRLVPCPISENSGGELEDSTPVQQLPLSSLQYKTDKQLRLRVRFAKVGEARFLSHLDLVRLFSRAVRRAGLPISYSQGYHPHPLISFTPPLQIGVESEAEYIDFILSAYVSPLEFTRRLGKVLIEGLQLIDIRQVPLKASALTQPEHLSAYRIWLPRSVWNNGQKGTDNIEYQKQHLQNFLNRNEIPITKGNGKVVDAKALINTMKAVTMDEETLTVELLLFSTSRGNVKPQEVVQGLYPDNKLTINDINVKKLRFWLKQGQHFFTPFGAN